MIIITWLRARLNFNHGLHKDSMLKDVIIHIILDRFKPLYINHLGINK